MKQPTYKMMRIALADCKPHADAEAYSASSEDRAALTNSINESGLLSPIAVVEEAKARGEGEWKAKARGEGEQRRDKDSSVHLSSSPSPTYYVIDGIGRMNALMAAGVTETDAQVFDLGDLSVAEFVVCKNAMMRKVTTGTRVMAYLKCHEREVLAAADPKKYNLRETSFKGKHDAQSYDRTPNDKGWSSREIAERIGVSDKDVLAGIELLKASAEAGEEKAKARGEGEGNQVKVRGEGEQWRVKNSSVHLSSSPSPSFSQMDLFETLESVLRGETPIRRWKAAAGGKVSKVGGKSAADYAGIAWRTVKSWRGVWENWQTVPMECRGNVIAEFRKALEVIPDDFRTVIEAVMCEECQAKAKAKRR